MNKKHLSLWPFTAVALFVVGFGCAAPSPAQLSQANDSGTDPQALADASSGSTTNGCLALYAQVAPGLYSDVIASLATPSINGVITVYNGYGIEYLALAKAQVGTLLATSPAPPVSVLGQQLPTFPLTNSEDVPNSTSSYPVKTLFDAMINANETVDASGTITTRTSPNGRLSCAHYTQPGSANGTEQYQCSVTLALTASAASIPCAQ